MQPYLILFIILAILAWYLNFIKFALIYSSLIHFQATNRDYLRTFLRQKIYRDIYFPHKWSSENYYVYFFRCKKCNSWSFLRFLICHAIIRMINLISLNKFHTICALYPHFHLRFWYFEMRLCKPGAFSVRTTWF